MRLLAFPDGLARLLWVRAACQLSQYRRHALCSDTDTRGVLGSPHLLGPRVGRSVAGACGLALCVIGRPRPLRAVQSDAFLQRVPQLKFLKAEPADGD